MHQIAATTCRENLVKRTQASIKHTSMIDHILSRETQHGQPIQHTSASMSKTSMDAAPYRTTIQASSTLIDKIFLMSARLKTHKKMHQTQPTTNSNNDTTVFITSFLPCSCPSCSRDPIDVTKCDHRLERSIECKPMQPISSSVDEDQGMSSLNIPELKDVCLFFSLRVSGRKDELTSRMMNHMEALKSTLFDGEDAVDDDADLD